MTEIITSRNRRKSKNLGTLYRDLDIGVEFEGGVDLNVSIGLPTAAPIRAIGKRIKTAKVPFDPSPEVVPSRRRPTSCESFRTDEERPAAPPLLVVTNGKKPKSTKCLCDVCGVAARDLYASCHVCQQTRIHLECLSQPGFPTNWKCNSCREMVARIESSFNSSAVPREVAVRRNVKPATAFNSKSIKPRNRRLRRRVGFAGFTPKELRRPENIDELSTEIIMEPIIPPHCSNVLQCEIQPKTEPMESPDYDSDIKPFIIEPSDTIPPTAVNAPSSEPRKTIEAPGTKWTPFTNLSDIVPYVGDWSISQVCEYFGEYVPGTSSVLLDEKIDGAALMLLKRSNILDLVKRDKDPLNLGTALKMYAHVVRLQTRSNDVRLGWQ